MHYIISSIFKCSKTF